MRLKTNYIIQHDPNDDAIRSCMLLINDSLNQLDQFYDYAV